MISFVRGIVRQVTAEAIVIDVGGVGLRVLPSASAVAHASLDQPVTLATSLVTREDGWTLFGFSDDEERIVFEALLGVSGVGPRTALAAVSVLGASGLRAAIAGADPGPLTRVPGIGRKGAGRIVLELSDRLAPPPSPAVVAATDWQADVLAGLVTLGWPAGQAEEALARVQSEEHGAVIDAAAGLRACLRILGGRP